MARCEELDGDLIENIPGERTENNDVHLRKKIHFFVDWNPKSPGGPFAAEFDIDRSVFPD